MRIARVAKLVGASLWLWLTVPSGGGPAVGTALAQANRLEGRIAYTGNLGPVNSRRPLCLCVYSDAAMTSLLGCLIYSANDVDFRISVQAGREYYLIAFLDIEINERPDGDEPFEIYRDHREPPADAVVAGGGTIEIVFGDENLAAPATSTPSASPTPTTSSTPTATASPSATREPTATPTPPAPICAGDCDASGTVTIDEIVRLVSIALGTEATETCVGGDIDGSGGVEIHEILAAIHHALDGC